MKITLSHDEIIAGLARVMQEKINDIALPKTVNPADCFIDHNGERPDLKITFSWEF